MQKAIECWGVFYWCSPQALVMSNVVNVATAPEYAVVFLVFYKCVCIEQASV